LLEANGKKILIDCGSGVLAQLVKIMPPHELDAVMFSHLHHDHISDFFVLQYAIMFAIKRGKRTCPLPIWAPVEPADWYAKLSYGDYVKKHAIEEGMELDMGNGLAFRFHRTEHAVPCYAMQIENGQHSILYGADAGPNTDWAKMGNTPDLFICEASYLHRDMPSQPVGHLSAKQAAEVAEQIQAKRLLITHLFPEYDPDQIAREATANYEGPCQVGESGLVIDLGTNENT
jgi:ribonuclease BN (tRNA processing enzyme)